MVNCLKYTDGDDDKAEKRKKVGGGKRRVRGDGEGHHHPKDAEQHSGDAAEQPLHRRDAAGFDAFQVDSFSIRFMLVGIIIPYDDVGNMGWRNKKEALYLLPYLVLIS